MIEESEKLVNLVMRAGDVDLLRALRIVAAIKQAEVDDLLGGMAKAEGIDDQTS